MAFQSFSATGQQGGGFDQAMAGLVGQEQFASQNATQGGALQLNQQQLQLQREQAQMEGDQTNRLALLRLLQGREELQGQMGLEQIRTANAMREREFSANRDADLEAKRQTFEAGESAKRQAHDINQQQLLIAASNATAAKASRIALEQQQLQLERDTAVARGDIAADEKYGPRLEQLQREKAELTFKLTVLGNRTGFTKAQLPEFARRFATETGRMRGIYQRKVDDGAAAAPEVIAALSSMGKTNVASHVGAIFGIPDSGSLRLADNAPNKGFEKIDDVPNGMQYLKWDKMNEQGSPNFGIRSFDELLLSPEEIRGRVVEQLSESVVKTLSTRGFKGFDPVAASSVIQEVIGANKPVEGADQKLAAAGLDPLLVRSLLKQVAIDYGKTAAANKEAYAAAKFEDAQNRAGVGHMLLPGIFGPDQKSMRTVGLQQQVVADDALISVLAKAGASISAAGPEELAALEAAVNGYVGNQDFAGLRSVQGRVNDLTDFDADFESSMNAFEAPIRGEGGEVFLQKPGSGREIEELLTASTAQGVRSEEELRRLNAERANHALRTRAGISSDISRRLADLIGSQTLDVEEAEDRVRELRGSK